MRSNDGKSSSGLEELAQLASLPSCDRPPAGRRFSFASFKRPPDVVAPMLGLALVLPYLCRQSGGRGTQLLQLQQGPLPPAAAAPLLSPVFSSSMVLQRAPRSSRLFGKSAPGTTVSVVLDPAQGHPGATTHATTSADGSWVAALPPQQASRGRSISISSSGGDGGDELTGGASATLSDLAFGDVFLCAGQSNMAVNVGNRLMMNQSAELAAAHLYDIRLFNNGVMWPPNPKLPNETWVAANATTLASFSDLCWLTGRDTFRALGGTVTVGLVSSCVGGCVQ